MQTRIRWILFGVLMVALFCCAGAGALAQDASQPVATFTGSLQGNVGMTDQQLNEALGVKLSGADFSGGAVMLEVSITPLYGMTSSYRFPVNENTPDGEYIHLPLNNLGATLFGGTSSVTARVNGQQTDQKTLVLNRAKPTLTANLSPLEIDDDTTAEAFNQALGVRISGSYIPQYWNVQVGMSFDSKTNGTVEWYSAVVNQDGSVNFRLDDDWASYLPPDDYTVSIEIYGNPYNDATVEPLSIPVHSSIKGEALKVSGGNYGRGGKYAELSLNLGEPGCEAATVTYMVADVPTAIATPAYDSNIISLTPTGKPGEFRVVAKLVGEHEYENTTIQFGGAELGIDIQNYIYWVDFDASTKINLQEIPVGYASAIQLVPKYDGANGNGYTYVFSLNNDADGIVKSLSASGLLTIDPAKTSGSASVKLTATYNREGGTVLTRTVLKDIALADLADVALRLYVPTGRGHGGKDAVVVLTRGSDTNGSVNIWLQDANGEPVAIGKVEGWESYEDVVLDTANLQSGQLGVSIYTWGTFGGIKIYNEDETDFVTLTVVGTRSPDLELDGDVDYDFDMSKTASYDYGQYLGVFPAYGEGGKQPYTVSWASGDTSVLTVNDQGVATFVGNGRTDIIVTVTSAGETCEMWFKVTVTGGPDPVETTTPTPAPVEPAPVETPAPTPTPAPVVTLVVPASYTATVGMEYQLVSWTPETSQMPEIKSASSSNAKVATISAAGKLVTLKAGTATITIVDASDKTYTCAVTVVANDFVRAAPVLPENPTGVITSTNRLYYKKSGKTVTLRGKVFVSNYTDASIKKVKNLTLELRKDGELIYSRVVKTWKPAKKLKVGKYTTYSFKITNKQLAGVQQKALDLASGRYEVYLVGWTAAKIDTGDEIAALQPEESTGGENTAPVEQTEIPAQEEPQQVTDVAGDQAQQTGEEAPQAAESGPVEAPADPTAPPEIPSQEPAPAQQDAAA